MSLVGNHLKIGVISDLHGNCIALNKVIEDLKKENISDIILLGDVVMKGPMQTSETRDVRRQTMQRGTHLFTSRPLTIIH